MYAWIWRKLPFGLPGKLVGSVLLTATAVSLLWYVVFPWAEPLLPFDDVQVTQDSGDLGEFGNPEDSGNPGPSAIPDESTEPGDPGAENDPAGSDEHDLPYSTAEPTRSTSSSR